MDEEYMPMETGIKTKVVCYINTRYYWDYGKKNLEVQRAYEDKNVKATKRTKSSKLVWT